MVLTFDKGRMIVAMATCVIGFVIGIILLVTVFDFGNDSVLAGAFRGGVIGGTVAAGAFGIVFGIHVSNAAQPVVTIDGRGIEFHRAEVGLIPWHVIETAGVERIMGAKRLVVQMKPPAPKPSFMTKLLFSLAAAKRGAAVRLTMPFGRFGADEAAVQAILDRRGAAA